ncbi:glutathione S-transferase-like protein [Mucidula mucida]|nr:glutathione S-transferase-like protein [Mucidula mucida]
MVLKLFGSRWSPNAKRVPFEAIEIDMINEEHKTPAYVAKQPFGQVPFIDDDGLIVYESRAICRYICKKYEHQGTAALAASVEVDDFDVYVQEATMEAIVKPALGGKMNKTVYEKALRKLGAKLDVYDGILGRQRYIAGDVLTLVDLFHIPYAAELEEYGCDIMQTRPHVAR